MKMNLWKENRLDKHYTLSFSSIIRAFKSSEQNENFKKGWPLERALRIFICHSLNSVFEEKEFAMLYEYAYKSL